MHRNIFIYLALVIAGCHGGVTERSIRVKRIAESTKGKKLNEKPETIEFAKDVPGDELLKDVFVGSQPVMKGQTARAERNVVGYHIGELNHSENATNIADLGNVNAKERRHVSGSQGEHGDDMMQLKEKENLRTDIVDEKVPERGLSYSKNEKMGDSKIYEESHYRQRNGVGGRGQVEHASVDKNKKTGLVAVVERTMNGDMTHRLEHSVSTDKPDHLRQIPLRHSHSHDGRLLSRKKDERATTSTGNENNPTSSSTVNSPTHNHVGTNQKLTDDFKYDRHGRNQKADVDVYLYSNTPEFYQAAVPIRIEMLNAKEFKSPPVATLESFEHQLPALLPPPLPYKWHQSRSAMQDAIDIVNRMVMKIGLDELESDEDYEVHGPSFIFGNGLMDKGGNDKFEGVFSAEANFCPFHGVRKMVLDIGGLKDDAPRNGECMCSLKGNARELQRNGSGLDDLDRTKRSK